MRSNRDRREELLENFRHNLSANTPALSCAAARLRQHGTLCAENTAVGIADRGTGMQGLAVSARLVAWEDYHYPDSFGLRHDAMHRQSAEVIIGAELFQQLSGSSFRGSGVATGVQGVGTAPS